MLFDTPRFFIEPNSMRALLHKTKHDQRLIRNKENVQQSQDFAWFPPRESGGDIIYQEEHALPPLHIIHAHVGRIGS